MPRMKAVQIAKPNATLEVVERDIPDPKPRQVRIKVQACGVCHSDMFTVTGGFPGIQYPRVPAQITLALLSRFCNWRDALVVVRPETMLRWHRFVILDG